jgi:zinc D-Ala-D-Ala carboxypeptidase
MTMNVSEHFSWGEVQYSTTAKARGIDNTVPESLHTNVLNTAARMEKVRAMLGNAPLRVTSWFRCPILNKSIGGSKTSAHMQGLAVDFKPTNMSLDEAFNIIRKSDLDFDQLILERTKDGAAWVHIGFTRGKPRREVLRAWGQLLGGPMKYARVRDSEG